MSQLFELSTVGDVTVVRPTLEKLYDEPTIATLRNELVAVVDKAVNKQFVLDMAPLTYVSSAGVGLVVAVNNRCQEAGGALHVCNAQPVVEEVIRISRLDRVFGLYPNLDDAVAAFD